MTVVRMKRRTPNYDEGQLGTLGRVNTGDPGIRWIEFGVLRHGTTGCWCGPGEYEVLDDRTTIVPGLKCLTCQENLNASTDATGSGAKPTPGALSICLYCGDLAAYATTTIGLTLRSLTPTERETALAEDVVIQILAAVLLRNEFGLPMRSKRSKPNGEHTS